MRKTLGPRKSPWRTVALAALLALSAGAAAAQTAAGYAEYIIPFDEDVFAYVTQPVSATTIGANDTTFTLVSVTAWTDAVTIYYDHWENGYGYDPNDPDGLGTDEKYTLNAGKTLNFSSAAVPRPRTGGDGNSYVGAGGNCNSQPIPAGAVALIRRQPDLCYDGRDRVITVGGATTVTRGGYFNTATMGKLAAIGEEVYPLSPQLIKYVLPFGEIPARNDYQQVLAVIQATEDDTLIQIDFNGDGVFDAFNTENGYRTPRVDPVDATTLTLQRGQAYILDRNSDGVANGTLLAKGTVILGTKTLQVEYFYGRTASNYDSRAVSAFPRGFWTKEYYASADGGNTGVCAGGVCRTDILLYNPTSGTITINWETTAGSGSFTMAANETAFFQNKTGGTAANYVPDGSGVYLRGSDVFWGTSDIDSNRNDWDWGYSLVPSYLLSQEQIVAWAPGNSPPQACNTANARGNGLFLTPVFDNTLVFIDADDDGTPDTNASIEVLRGQTALAPTSGGYRANRLESLYITGSNVTGAGAGSLCDLTGARIYATGPFSMSYGENPDKTSAGGGLDLGYTVLPSPANWMDLALTVDKSTSPVLVSTLAGVTTVTFTLVVESHEFNIDSLSVVDTLPANWTYDAGSTVITLPNLTQISGGAADPTVSLPTLTWGAGQLGSLLPHQQIVITFDARTTAPFANGAVTVNNVGVTGTRTVGGVTQTFKASDFAFNTFTDGSLGMTLTKQSSVPEPVPVSPGDTLTYTLTPGNPAGTTTTLTGVTVYDPLPPGVSYVAGSGSVTCERGHNVRDEFATAAYNNQGPNNTDNWAGTWSEVDVQGATAGATAGYVLVTGGVLRLRGQTSTVRDDFTSSSYARQDGTNLWTGNWTESGDDGTPGGGAVTADAGNNNRLNFGPGTTGRSISRTAAVSGGSVTISFTLSDNGIDPGEGVVAEYDLGAGWVEMARIDNGTQTGTNPLTISTAGATSITLRFTSFDTGNATFEGTDNAGVDAVLITYNDAVGSSVQRSANLTGAISPVLSFSTATANLEASDTLVVEASSSAAGPFTVLATYAAGTPDVAPPYDLTSFVSASTTIRFRVAGNFDVNDETFSIDNVDINYGVSSTFASGAPPELVPAASACRLRPNTSMTVTFQVTVDDPFPTGQDEIVNVVTSGAAQIPVPLQASARNIVIVPGGLTATVGDRVWLDIDADGVFDPGETGLAGIELTLEDQFGTPLQVTTTNGQGLYSFIDVPAGSGYFVEITGGLPSGLSQTTDTVRDAFDVNGIYSGNAGTLNWSTNWTETGDNANAATGDIRAAGNRIEFRDTVGTVAANESLQRSVTVAGATSIEVQYAWAGTGLVPGSDRVAVEYSTNGTTWTTLRTLNADAAQAFTDTLPWTPTDGTFLLRYRTQDVLETGKLATIDDVQVRFPQSLRTAAFNLAPGQDYLQADLGFRPAPNTSVIGDLVWVDANGDQLRNPGEPGLGGITVQLYLDTNGDGQPDGLPVATTVTAPDGSYLFTGIAANGTTDWVVTLDYAQPGLAGYTGTTNSVFSYLDLPAGVTRLDADFGFRNDTGTFSITDGVWLDNGLPSGTASNGLKDGTEAGIAGVTVELLDASSNAIAFAVTGSDGKFTFSGVPGGQNYRWRVTDTAGVLADYYGTTTAAQVGSFQMPGNLTGNLDYTAPADLRHFGYNQTRSIGDTVWNDLDNDATVDAGEPRLSGVTLLLYRDDGDGIFEPAAGDGSPMATQVTDANGQYLFAGLAAGTYWVSVDDTQSALAGYTLTTGDNSGVAGHQLLVTPALSGTANRLDIDFGYRATTPFEISGRFFNDQNDSGGDNGEPGFAGVTVELRNSSGIVVGTTTTAPDGSYGFPGLPAATYTVRPTDTAGVLAGYETTYERTEGGLAGAYDGQETVTLGPSVANVDFGYYYRTTIVTRAFVSSFVAREVSGAVALEWITTAEVGTVGFYLRRWDERAARHADVNEKLLPAAFGSRQGAVYRFVDPGAVPGEPASYELVEVEASASGASRPFGVDTRLTLDDPGAEAALDDEVLRRAGYSRTPRPIDPEPGRARLDERPSPARPTTAAAGAKVGVAAGGLYYLSLAELQAGGVSLPPLGSFGLTNRGGAVAYAPAADLAGLYFYGLGPSANVERDNVYRLSGESAPVLMASRPNPDLPPPTGDETYLKTATAEQDTLGLPELFHDPAADFWIWDYFFTGDGAKSFPFRADGATRAGQAWVTVRLKGGSDTPTAPEHHAAFSLNGTPIGEVWFDGLQAVETTQAFDASLLVDGENTLTIAILDDTGAPYSLFYLDSFDVRFSSTYRAHGNRLECPAAGHAAVLISGFTRPDVAVFDVTTPARPEIVQAPVSLQPDGTYGVVVGSTGRRAVYLALTPDAVSSVTRVLADTPSALRPPENAAQYLVITTAELKAEAQALADYRSDLISQVVDIEDVYDEFNDGVPSPYALRDFLAWARARWQTPPRYVVLAGDGSYDYRDVQGLGDNLIPPLMANTPSGLTPSDASFVASPRAPELGLSIGRLPVATPAELADVVAKIQDRESALGEPWVWSVVLAADDYDPAGDFPHSSEALAVRLPAETLPERAYVAPGNAAAARGLLMARLAQGAGLVNYFGHGGYEQLADELLLRSADVATLPNPGKPTVLTALTCLVGNAAVPGYPGLGERLLRQPDRGAVAVWAPTGMTENELAEPLAQALYAALFTGRRVERLGDAVAIARHVYRAGDRPEYLLAVYNLLGDPALRVR